MDTIINFAKVRDSAVIPSKREEDAGFDIYANFEENYMIIDKHETVMIPTGIACACDKEYCFIIKERGSTGTKGMAQRCGVVDSGYRGEIFAPITNTSNNTLIILKRGVDISELYKDIIPKDITIYPYEKAIAQLLLIPVPSVSVKEITFKELQEIPSVRGGGNLGSSKK